MKSKLTVLLAVMTMFTAVTFAQVTFGVRAGLNLQNINGKDSDGDKLENKLLPGFNVGANAEIPIAQDFYLQPGLLFSTKGAKDKEDDVEFKVSISYIELPIHLVYKPQLGEGKLILGFGPYLAYGVGGKSKGELGGISVESDVKFKNKMTTEDLLDDNTYLKPFDAGADIFFGYEFAFKLSVQLNAQLGLLGINPGYEGDDDDKTLLKNTGFGISLGYRF